MLMKKKYLGGFISRKLNYGNWLNWVYIATIGFPIQFVVFYSRRFLRNLFEKHKHTPPVISFRGGSDGKNHYVGNGFSDDGYLYWRIFCAVG
jgi:hypothetical protein